MDWKAKRPRIEIAVEWSAAWVVGAAVGFALVRLGAGGLMVAGGGGIAVAVGALFLLRQIDRDLGMAGQEFALVDYPVTDGAGDDVLLLDDPLPLPGESRVVRLFTAAPDAETGREIPPPGEMLARIETFLGAGRGGAAEPAPAHIQSVEANAALHAALADIRASLRRG